MNLLNKRAFTILASLFFFFVAAAAMNKVTADAKASVVYVYSDNCPMCNTFESNVMSASEVKKELARFKYTKMHISKAPSHVEGTPTILIYNSKNQQVRKMMPPPLNKAKFISELKKY